MLSIQLLRFSIFLTKYVQSRLLQNCRMMESVNAIFNYLSILSLRQVHLLMLFLAQTSTPHNSLSKLLAALPQRLLAHVVQSVSGENGLNIKLIATEMILFFNSLIPITSLVKNLQKSTEGKLV